MPGGEQAFLARLEGWAGVEWYASGFDSPVALLDGLFKHPARVSFSCSKLQASETLMCHFYNRQPS